jgi:hypothetical protein
MAVAEEGSGDEASEQKQVNQDVQDPEKASSSLDGGDATEVQEDADVGPHKSVTLDLLDDSVDSVAPCISSVTLDGEGPHREHVSIQLGNNDFYEGEVFLGQMDGHGHYTFADGNVSAGLNNFC